MRENKNLFHAGYCHCRPISWLRIVSIVALCSMIPGALIAAEQRYISDRITLNMYQDASLSERIGTVKSGVRVEVLQTGDGYSQVSTDEGKVGWVRSSYLVDKKPAGVRVAELQEELDALRSKHADLLIEQVDEPIKPDADLVAKLEAAEAARETMKLRLNELEQERTRYINETRKTKQLNLDTDESRTLLLWIILPILALITGFFLGWKYLESRIRARFGGFNPL